MVKSVRASFNCTKMAVVVRSPFGNLAVTVSAVPSRLFPPASSMLSLRPPLPHSNPPPEEEGAERRTGVSAPRPDSEATFRHYFQDFRLIAKSRYNG